VFCLVVIGGPLIHWSRVRYLSYRHLVAVQYRRADV